MSQQSIPTGASAPATTLNAPPERPGWVVPMIIGCAILMLTLEGNIMSNALPAMARALHEEPLRLNVAITMFMLAVAVCLPISGWIADRFGARRVLTTCMVLFAVSSAGCGLAHTLGQLVVARICQGAAAALIQPVGRLVLLRSTAKENLVKALAILSTPILLGPVIGPVLGGFIVTYFDWRWIFFINLPLALVGVILIRTFVPEVARPAGAAPPLDWFGMALMATGLASFMFGVENLGHNVLGTPALIGLFATSFASLGYYALVHVRRIDHPAIDLSLYRLKTFRTSTVGGLFVRLGLGAQPLMFAMLLQVGFGMSAFAAGILGFVSAVPGFFIRFTNPPMLHRFGFRGALTVSGIAVGATFAACALFRPTTPFWLIGLVLGAGGFFRFMLFNTLNTLAYAEIAPEQMSQASTSAAMAQQMTLTAGVGLASVLLQMIQHWNGHATLVWQDITPGFLILGVLTFGGLYWFTRLPRDAGEGLYRKRAA